ncbi:restriction endonuclease subunit S [Streptococcus suis]|nr:restriction endonuclease subunit S [Streptococcus suis]
MPNKDKNIPKRRFKAFENADAWELRKLKLLFIFKYGDGNNNPSNGGPYPVFGAGGVQGGYTEYNSENSIIIGHMGDAGCVSWGEGKHFVTYNGTITRPKEEVFTAKFGYYLLSKMNLRQYRGGSGLPFLTYDMLNDMDTIVPTNKSECDKISEFFSTLDQQITLHQRKLDKLKNVKQAYLSEMFPAEGERVPKRRFPGFTDAWELRKLGELTSYRNGKGYEDNQSDFGKYELINLNSISIEGGLKPSGKFINSASETLNKNDLVMVLSDVGHGDLLGRVAIIPEDDRFVLNQRVALLRNNDYADCKYLFSYINANQHYFKLQGAGSSQLNISKKAVENFVVHIPSPKEQSAIGTFFSTLDRHITLHQRKLEKLKNLKKALLNELFV